MVILTRGERHFYDKYPTLWTPHPETPLILHLWLTSYHISTSLNAPPDTFAGSSHRSLLFQFGSVRVGFSQMLQEPKVGGYHITPIYRVNRGVLAKRCHHDESLALGRGKACRNMSGGINNALLSQIASGRSSRALGGIASRKQLTRFRLLLCR